MSQVKTRLNPHAITVFSLRIYKDRVLGPVTIVDKTLSDEILRHLTRHERLYRLFEEWADNIDGNGQSIFRDDPSAISRHCFLEPIDGIYYHLFRLNNGKYQLWHIHAPNDVGEK